ncbi:MAG: shikimate kinase [Planctomycetaceae bacterium]
MVITFIGYRGSGKSTLAQIVASRLGWECVDADREIESRAGKTIREIFADSGESEFRKWERAVMSDLLNQNQIVIAAGGGAILNEQTRAEMKAAGPVVWLNASAPTLWNRIQGDSQTTDSRPNLTNDGGFAEVERLLAKREPLYRDCASMEIDVESSDIEQLADSISQALRNELPEGTSR